MRFAIICLIIVCNSIFVHEFKVFVVLFWLNFVLGNLKN